MVPQAAIVFQTFKVIQTKVEDLNRIQQNLQPIISQIQRVLVGLLDIKFTHVRTDYQALQSDRFILADSRGGQFDVVLPKSATMTGHTITVKRDGSSNHVIVRVLSDDHLDGGTSHTLTNTYSSISLVATDWGWVSYAKVP